jgi:hypothetical protein
VSTQGEIAETPGGKQTPGSKASVTVKDSKFGETIVEEVRSRYTAALSHLPDPALRLLQIQVSVTVMLTGVALVEMGYDKELRV